MKLPVVSFLLVFSALLAPLHAQRGPNSASTPFLSPNAKLIKSPGNYDLVVIGDSITRRWSRFNVLQKTFAPWRVLNLGHDGEHTENILYRLQNGELAGVKSKVVMILIGTNNIGHTKDQPAWIAAGVSKIVETVRARVPNAQILVLGIFPRGQFPNDPKTGKPSPFRTRIAETNKLLAGLDNGQDVTYMDIGEDFLDANGELPKSTFPDSLHPTSEGYGIWYKAVRPTLDQLRKP